MRKIHKYPLAHAAKYQLTLPVGSQILSVATQHDRPQLWAKINPEETRMEDHTIHLVATGEEMCEEANQARFLGTSLCHGDSLVFHVFVGTVKPQE